MLLVPQAGLRGGTTCSAVSSAFSGLFHELPNQCTRRGIWKQLKSLTREVCTAYLQDSLPIAQEVSEPLNLFCVLCARNDIEASIMDIQAWRKHLQQVHGVME